MKQDHFNLASEQKLYNKLTVCIRQMDYEILDILLSIDTKWREKVTASLERDQTDSFSSAWSYFSR